MRQWPKYYLHLRGVTYPARCFECLKQIAVRVHQLLCIGGPYSELKEADFSQPLESSARILTQERIELNVWEIVRLLCEIKTETAHSRPIEVEICADNLIPKENNMNDFDQSSVRRNVQRRDVTGCLNFR